MHRILLPLLLALLTTFTSAAANPTPASAAVRSEATYSYGGHVRQTLDAYWYPSATAQPALVILHGGYWYEDTSWATWSRTFSDQGYAVFSVDYRLNFDAPWPAQRDDTLDAIDWIKAHAADFDIDPARVAVLGSSAGGHLATVAGTYGAAGSRIKTAVGLSPVASPYRAWNDGNASTDAKQRKVRDNATILARCYPDSTDTDTSMHPSCWDTWVDMVAKNRASGGDDAPMYLVHSEGDFVTPTHSTDLESVEETKGMPAGDITTEVVAGSSAHGAALLDDPATFDKVLAWLDARV